LAKTLITIKELSDSTLKKSSLIAVISAKKANSCWQILKDIKPQQTSLEKFITRGGLPPAYLQRDNSARQEWFRGYIKSYLERDVRDLSRIQRLYEYQKFLSLLAYRCAQILNRSDLARDCGIPYTTAAHFLIYSLPPFKFFLSSHIIEI